MADQKSRGGQKDVNAPKGQEEKNRDVHPKETHGQHGERDMKEDAARGQQGDDGGYHGQHGHNKQD